MKENDLRAIAEQQLQEWAQQEGIERRAVYRPGEVCQLLRISPTTIRLFCDLAEHPQVRKSDPRAIQSFKTGSHRRISHSAIIDWLIRNQTFQRENPIQSPQSP